MVRRGAAGMGIWLIFGAGVLLGLILGTILTCLIQVNRHENED